MLSIPNTDLRISPMSLGTAELGTKIGQDDTDALLDAYVAAGGNVLDTAHCYACWTPGGIGASERAIGSWMRRRGAREQIVISTKGGHPPMEIFPEYAHPADFLSAAALAQDAAESMERLGTDVIDLYYLHRDDGVTPVSEVIDSLNNIPGLRYLGASNWSIARVSEANDYARRTGKRGFVALQNQWSLAVPNWTVTADPVNRFVTPEDARWCEENGVLNHPYSSTANGYFARDDWDGPYAGSELRRARVRELAAREGLTPTQVALIWLMSQPGVVVPIIGTTQIERVLEAHGAIGRSFDAATLAWLAGD